jgi:hypothetical protein
MISGGNHRLRLIFTASATVVIPVRFDSAGNFIGVHLTNRLSFAWLFLSELDCSLCAEPFYPITLVVRLSQQSLSINSQPFDSSFIRHSCKVLALSSLCLGLTAAPAGLEPTASTASFHQVDPSKTQVELEFPVNTGDFDPINALADVPLNIVCFQMRSGV